MMVRKTTTARRRRQPRQLLLMLEFALLFFALPLAYVVELVDIPVIPALWVLASGCLAFLLTSPSFDRRQLWNADRLERRVRYVWVPFILAAPLLTVGTALFFPEKFFGFVRERPLFWAVVMVLYPILSVYPQGIVYRSFIFHRYRELFPGRWSRILASAAAFSMVHVVFQNWIAPLLTLFGGVLFAWTYERTRSALVATLLHAAFGCLLFTIGLGWYFYYAAMRANG